MAAFHAESGRERRENETEARPRESSDGDASDADSWSSEYYAPMRDLMESGDGEWVNRNALASFFDDLYDSEVKWLGAAFDGGYKNAVGALGFEILYSNEYKKRVLYRKWQRLPQLRGWSFEAEAKALQSCCFSLNDVWLLIFFADSP